ncbi:MAG: TonB-dependent receptor [Sphingomonadales bacterium]|nr:TonB-dependent receptor [Sphingomonadales bacterium]
MFQLRGAVSLSVLALAIGAASTASTSAASPSSSSASSTSDALAAAPASDADASDGNSITVVGRNEKSVLARSVTIGVLGNKSVLDTPFSITAVTSDEIQDLQTKDINGVFRSDASIREVNSSVAAASGAVFRVRGVALDQLNSFKIDGLVIPYWSIDFPIEQFDQVQLFKGATGFMYGFGSPAGVVNFVTKRAGEGFNLGLDAGYRSDSLFSGHVDVGDRLANGRFGYRVNLQGEFGKTYLSAKNSNYSVDVALDYKITDNLTWSADGFYMKTRQDDQVNTVSVGAAVTHLAPVSGSASFGAKGNWKTNEMGVGTTGLAWNLGSNWTAKLRYRWSKLDEDFPGNLVTITNNAGDFTSNAFFVKRIFKFNQVQSTVDGSVSTGPFNHELILGAEYEVQGQFSDAQSLTQHPIGSGNIYTNLNINLNAYPTGNYRPVVYELNHYIQKSLFAADTISLGKFSLLLGLRYTDYEDTVRSATDAVTAVYKAHPISPTIALTYSLAPSARAYVSFVKGLQNGGAAGATNVNNGETFGPIETKQYEAGLKADHGKWNGAVAIFRTEQDANYVTVDNRYVQSGKVRYQGAEASVAVRLTAPLTLSASAAYLHTELLNEGPVYTGKRVPGVPEVQLTFGASYQLPILPALRLNANVKYTDAGYGNTLNTLRFPSYTTVDLGASYALAIAGHKAVVRVGIKNVSDERYWTYGSSTVIPGEPRTAAANIHFEF